MGGTFDPIHNGHLLAAEFVLNKLGLDKILFIPAGVPNFKLGQKIAPAKDRLIMSCLATVGNDKFEVSSIEIDKEDISYTFDTIQAVKNATEAEVYFIIGSDIIDSIQKWYKVEQVFQLCKFVLVNRPNHEIDKKLDAIRRGYNADITFVEIPWCDISSTKIRGCIKNNMPITGLVPSLVEKYIIKNNLYADIFEGYIKDELHKFMGSFRYKHTLGVAAEARRLAKFYNVDEEKAVIAAYMHDLAKEFPKAEMINMCLKYNIKVEGVLDSQIEIAHGFVSAEIARDYYGVTDTMVLNAIRYHSTGRKNMTMLDAIIYIADAIEPNRKKDRLTEKLRLLAYTDIKKAMALLLEFTIENIESKGKEAHQLSKKALKGLS
jgi:nicotinate-nucleotide adenylyltransferase